jgi:hypothetical protein
MVFFFTQIDAENIKIFYTTTPNMHTLMRMHHNAYANTHHITDNVYLIYQYVSNYFIIVTSRRSSRQ